MKKKYSVIIPAYNEEENIEALLTEVHEVMSSLGEPWEVLVVDDASTDGTWKRVCSQKCLGIRLEKRCGQTTALQVGLREACGDIFIILDGDGQNDPHDIPLLLQELSLCDCVSGYRQDRHDAWHKKLLSKVANSVRRFVLGDDIIDTGCSLKVLRRECVANIPLFRGMHRFLSSLILIEGYTVKQGAVSHRPRVHGASKYTLFNRGISVFFDLLAVCWMKRGKVFSVVKERSP